MGIFFFAPILGVRERGEGNTAPSLGAEEPDAAKAAPAGTAAAANNPLPVLVKNSLRLSELESGPLAIKNS
jgi:hypothetical protein